MRFALSSRQPFSFLNEADEIRVKYNDKDFIYTIFDRFTDKFCILEIPYKVEKVDWNEIYDMARMSNKFVCRLARIEDSLNCEDLGIPWFYGMIIDNYEDLNWIAGTNSAQVVIGGDLLFDLNRVRTFNKQIRVCPNEISISLLSNYGKPNNKNITLVGDWIGPGGIGYYEDLIDSVEFSTDSEKSERGFFNFYKKGNIWPIEMNKLIRGLECSDEVKGRLFDVENFYKARMNCRRECLKTLTPTCHVCERQFWIADKERLINYKKAMEEKKEKESGAEDQLENN